MVKNMGMDLSNVLSNFKGITPIPLRLPLTTVWYLVRIPSDRCKLAVIYNNDPTNRLYLTIVQKGIDPNKVGNFNTTQGRILIDKVDGITVSIMLDVWIMPTAANQDVVAWAFSEEPIDNKFGTAYGK